MTDILIISPTRAEAGPLASVIAALPEARVIADSFYDMRPDEAHAAALHVFTKEFRRESPKLVLLLGDRYETHAAALAAHFLRIPIAHIHGGETTTGAFDDALRHGITHMARLHFVATEDAGRQVGRMLNFRGLPDALSQIYVVGAPGLDTIAQGSAKRDQKLIVVSYYPETLSPDYGLANLLSMLAALEPYTADHAIFFSQVNSDPGSVLIRDNISAFIIKHPMAVGWISPSSREQYLHICERARFAIGNSSSLVIECPWMGLPSVVVGARQDGRPMANSIFNVGGMHRGPLDLAGCMAAAADCDIAFHPIYRGGAAPKIAEICREFVSK